MTRTAIFTLKFKNVMTKEKFSSVFSRDMVKEVDDRIQKQQEAYNANMRKTLLETKDYPITR